MSLKNIFISSIILLLLANKGFSQSDSILYSFFIAGHTYGGAGVNNEGLHPPFVDMFDYIQGREEIKFAVFTGDIVSTATAEDWDEVDVDIDSLDLPVYFAVGNHDMQDRPLFESRYGDTYYDFIYENDLFIILDPNLDAWSILDEQLEFLENTLDSNAQNVDNIFVFFHQILCWENDNIYADINPNSFAGRGDSVNFWTDVEPLFTALSNPVLMCMGDVGAAYWSDDFMYDSYDNITFIASGMGEEVGDNIVVINVDTEKNRSYELICLNETELYCFGDLTDYQLSTSIDESRDEVPEVVLYPNPVKDWLNIELNEPSTYLLELYSSNGKLLFSQNINQAKSHQINVSDFPNGLYFIRLSTESQNRYTKIVISR